MTLMELILATGISLVILGVVFFMDVGRTRMHQDQRLNSAVLTEQAGAALSGVVRLTKYLEEADRIVLPKAETVQFRTYIGATACAGGTACPNMLTTPPPAAPPDPCCFDVSANYRWDEAAHAGANQLILWDNTGGGCGVSRVLATQITSATFQFANDVAPPPPGGEPSPNDLNLLQYIVTWDDGVNRSQIFAGQVASRAIPYSNLGASATDSGQGLAVSGATSPPPVGTCS